MIKRYNQFIKGKVNENIEENEPIDNSTGDIDAWNVEDDDKYKNSEEEEIFDNDEEEAEEEGGQYIGQQMMQELSDALDLPIDTDGSINYDGRKINFFSETEMFHVGREKFENVEDVVNFLQGDNGQKVDDQTREREIEDDHALLNNDEDQDETKDEETFESKSYKKSRFESYKKKK